MSHTALITGASRGIGRAIARRLSPAFDIIALARSAPALDALGAELAAAGGRCTPLAVDLRDPAATARALDGVNCDVLVNNAGLMHRKPFLDLTPNEWHEMVDVNFNAVYHVTRAVLPGMVARGTGHVINIASIAGRSAVPGAACYAATKHAILGLSESLMLELREHGVKVSCVMPGSVATDFVAPGTDTSWMLRPDDVAECVAQIVASPKHALIYNVEIRAARPKKQS